MKEFVILRSEPYPNDLLEWFEAREMNMRGQSANWYWYGNGWTLTRVINGFFLRIDDDKATWFRLSWEDSLSEV